MTSTLTRPVTTTSTNPLGTTLGGAVPNATRNQEATIYVGNLDEQVNESILWELFLQVGPVVHVHIPRDRVTGQHQGYGFVEFAGNSTGASNAALAAAISSSSGNPGGISNATFLSSSVGYSGNGEDDAEYAMKVMNGVKLFGRPIKINRTTERSAAVAGRQLDVGANLFIGNLAPEVDESTLQATFSLFGTLIYPPKVARDPETGISKGYGFVNYNSFEASDAAIEAMNGQYLANKPITVNYAFRKDGAGGKGERHGSAAERLLAAQATKKSTGTAGNAITSTPTIPSSNTTTPLPVPPIPSSSFLFPTPSYATPVGVALPNQTTAPSIMMSGPPPLAAIPPPYPYYGQSVMPGGMMATPAANFMPGYSYAPSAYPPGSFHPLNSQTIPPYQGIHGIQQFHPITVPTPQQIPLQHQQQSSSFPSPQASSSQLPQGRSH